MDKIIEIIKRCLEKIVSIPGHEELFGLLMFALLGFFFQRRLMKLMDYFIHLKEKFLFTPKALEDYNKSLENETYKLNHSWKLSGQTLRELIIPVKIFKDNKNTRIRIEEYLKDSLKNNGCKRFLLLGEAGSGKSVALGLISRKLGELKRAQPILPILLSFSEIKHVRTKEEFEKSMIHCMERHRFGRGQFSIDYLRGNLYKGNIFLLIDGFDELEKSVRVEIASFLNTFFQTHLNIPFIISSRISVWIQNQHILPSLYFEIINMADFTPFEIRQFVSQWEFGGEKNAEQLAELINSKVYLKYIAANPLMLTIITFLYTQPNRVLPDNRVKFYLECIDALMVKWDNSKLIERANHFDTVDKKQTLSLLAYEHITNVNSTDEEISKNTVLDVITKALTSLSRPVAKRELMLSEIVQNAELLIEIPPSDYKFPHRTFMEFFAANYFFSHKKYKELLNLYQNDKGKWQETLSLYCGLNEDPNISNFILTKLHSDLLKTQNNPDPNTFVFKALVESSCVTPDMANQILNQANQLLNKSSNQQTIEQLGYIAVNPNWEYSVKAREILINHLSSKLSSVDAQKIIFALAYVKDDQMQNIIFEYLNKIDIVQLFTKIGSDIENVYLLRLLNIMDTERLISAFIGLKEAGQLEHLCNLLYNNPRKEIKYYAAWTLALASQSDLFYDIIDKVNYENNDSQIQEKIDFYYSSFTWNEPIPKTILGQKTIFYICYLAAELLVKTNFSDKNTKDIHFRLKYLISAILHSKGYSFRIYNLIELQLVATYTGIKTHWKNKRKHSGDDYAYVLMYLYPIINLLGLIKFGFQNNALITLFTFSCVGVYLIKSEKLIGFLNDWKYLPKARSLAILFIPHLLLLNHLSLNSSLHLEIQKVNFLNRPFFILLMGIILIILFLSYPIPYDYKLLNVFLIIVMALLCMLSSFLNPFGKYIQNMQIHHYLSGKA